MCYRNPISTRKYAFIKIVAQYLQMKICYLQVVDKALLHLEIKETTKRSPESGIANTTILTLR